MIRTAIIGASGYSGAELLRILSTRDDVAIEHLVAASSAGKRIDEMYPVFAGTSSLACETLEDAGLSGLDVAFVALPSGEAMKTVPSLLNAARKVIDLSGDFRLSDPQVYKEFYRHDHVAPDLLNTAVYGLPELNHDRIAAANFVTNPGCYPTSAILPLLPVVKHGIVSLSGIAITSMSGTSGAGRSSSVDMSFSEVNENIRAYKVGTHQHIPEIIQTLSVAAGKPVQLSFVPHLVPMTRGIFTTIHASLATRVTDDEITAVYTEFYRDAPFVRIRSSMPQVKDVVRTNYCDIAFAIEKRTNQLILLSVIDNLVKGAAGQAVQNMNIMLGLDETKGLTVL